MDWKTPTDAVEKGSFFYIMRNKAVRGMDTPDGKHIQFLYQDAGRLPGSAGFTGNVKDKEILDLLGTAEGFKKLVKGIGITVTKDPDSKGKADKSLFCFQFYGKTDAYVSGTTLTKEVNMTGAEEYLDLTDAAWSDDDNVPGQIRFEFPAADVTAYVTVKLYTYPGYNCPENIPEREVDVNSKAFSDMIKRSVMNEGNLSRIAKAIKDGKDGKEITIAFIGGSITQGAGAVPINEKCYAYLTYLNLCELCNAKPFTNVKYVKAGIGGTPSELGMLRYDRDVTDYGKINPDIVIVEFAVNDGDDETQGVCFDSLVRHILKQKNAPAVIIEFSVFANDWNLQERLSPVGFKYDLPMSSVRDAVVPEFLKAVKDDPVIMRSEYFYDQFHPTNIGHVIMAGGIGEILSAAAAKADEFADADIESLRIVPGDAPIGDDFTDIILVDRKDAMEGVTVTEGDFTGTDNEIQAVERDFDLALTPCFPYNYLHTEGDRPFVIELDCKRFVLIFKDSSSINTGIAEVYDNGEKKLTLDPKKVGWTHCHPIIVTNEKETKHHRIEVRMAEGSENKHFTVLGFGIVK